MYNGVLKKPSTSSLIFIPQRPLMTMGSLRDQVIYPDTKEEMETKGWTDEDLMQVMDTVTLNHIIVREGGWDNKADWKVGIIYKHYVDFSSLGYNWEWETFNTVAEQPLEPQLPSNTYLHPSGRGSTLKFEMFNMCFKPIQVFFILNIIGGN